MLAVLIETLRILNESAIYLLLGFALAGLLHVLISRNERILAPLTGRGTRPVVLASLLGLPLPLCSCSVLPTALALRERGAGKGATSSFLISVPETDVVSILLTYALIGPVMAVYRPLASLATGIGTGLLVDLADGRLGRFLGRHTGAGIEAERRDGATGSTPDGTSGPSGKPVGDLGPGGIPPLGTAGDACCRDDSCAASTLPSRPTRRQAWWREAGRFGFIEFYDDLIGDLILGVVIGALIAAVLPSLELTRVAGHQWISYLVMLVVGIPMYVCATASTPIAASLIAGGVGPGAALVFLLAGPATNMASLIILSKRFGRLVFAVHLTSIMVMSLLAGILLDVLASRFGFMAIETVPLEERTWSVLGLASTVAVLLLTFFSLRRTRAVDRAAGWLEGHGIRLRARTLLWTVVIAALVLYLLSGLFVVKPGERAAVTTFGKVTSSHLGPGLRVHWPRPFGGYDKIAVDGVQRVEIGFRSAVPSAEMDRASARAPGALPLGRTEIRADITEESWMLSGDENIVDVGCVIHYRIRDSREAVLRYMYGVEDPASLVRDAGEWSIRKVVAGMAIDSLLTVARGEVEQRVHRENLQPVLDLCDSGLEVISVSLNSVHAPYPVHWSFRDVASAAEDAEQSINRAREYREQLVRQAWAESTRSVQLSMGSAATHRGLAAGEATAFTAQSMVYRQDPRLMRSRLHFESLDSVLPGRRKYVDLTGQAGRNLELWLRRGSGFDQAVPFLPPSGTGGGGGER